jgi:hypothetical protein
MTADPVLDALDGLERAISQNAERQRMITERIEQVRAARAQGRGYSEIVFDEQPPLIVQLVTECTDALGEYGVQLRRAEAQALYEEGLKMEQIAMLFGVTRQRVSTLLKPTGR